MGGVPASYLCGNAAYVEHRHRDGLHHLAAAQERRQLVKQFAPTPQHADAGRAAHLVTGEGHQLNTKGLDVDRQMRHRLRRVEYDERAEHMRAVGDRAAPDSGCRECWTRARRKRLSCAG